MSDDLSGRPQARQSIMGISSAPRASFSQHHGTSDPIKLHADTALHECPFLVTGSYSTFISTYSLMCDTSQEGAALTITTVLSDDSERGAAPQAFGIPCLLIPTTTPCGTCHHYPHPSEEETKSGRLGDLPKVTPPIRAPDQGKTAWLQNGCSEATDSQIYTNTKLDPFPGAWIRFKIKLLATENSGVYQQRIH